MNRKKVKNLLNELKNTKVLNKEDYKALLAVLNTLDGKDIALFEAEVSELAFSELQIDKEISDFAKLILEMAHFKFTEVDLFSALARYNREEQVNFNLFTITSFDVFKVKRVLPPFDSNSMIRSTSEYHAVIGITYNGTSYTFGYNKYKFSLSYTINNGPVRWFNFPKAKTASRSDHLIYITSTIKNILNI